MKLNELIEELGEQLIEYGDVLVAGITVEGITFGVKSVSGESDETGITPGATVWLTLEED